jgi:hypothetical protein
MNTNISHICTNIQSLRKYKDTISSVYNYVYLQYTLGKENPYTNRIIR